MTDITLSPNDARKIAINRIYNTVPTYTIPANSRVGISQTTPIITDTALDIPIPITTGTINDECKDAFTGSTGGDNTTDNVTTYKIGGATSDNTSQNLIKNGTNVTGIWTKAPETNFVITQFLGFWIYIKDAPALAKFKTSGTCLTIKVGSDASNYYSKTYELTNLAIGWNWLNTGATIISALTATGTPTGSIDTLIVEIITNLSTDTFIAGDVLIDCVRTYNDTTLKKAITILEIDETAYETTMELRLEATESSGFLVDSLEIENTDATPKLDIISKYPSQSKSDSDIIIYTVIKRIL